MSKSKGNTVSPNEIAQQYGVDTLRMYMLFMGPPELDNEWQSDSIRGVFNFLRKLWSALADRTILAQDGEAVSEESNRRFHKFLKEYSERLDRYLVNTAVASIMEYYNDIQGKHLKLSTEMARDLLVAIGVMVPYFSSELLEQCFGMQLHEQTWPVYNPLLAIDAVVEVAVQVNGKLRATIMVDRTSDRALVEQKAREAVEKWIGAHTVATVVFVPGRLVNFVIA